MREYGQIQCSFWSDPDIQGVSNDAKLIAAYLLSGPHSNGLGCYRIPDGYIQADLGMSAQTISKGFTELLRMGFAYRCETTNFVLIPKFLKWNPIANKNVAAAREKEFKAIPEKFSNYGHLCGKVLEYGNHLPDSFETVLKRYAKQDPTLPDPIQTQPRPEPTVSESKKPTKEKPIPDESITNVIDYLNITAGRKYQRGDANDKLIRARLKEGHSEDTLCMVIDRKCAEWRNDEKMSKFLRPATLFNSEKFAQYVGEIGVETSDERQAREMEEFISGTGGNVLTGEVVS